jgi:uncharacterized delta-60 repeat protein
MSSTPPRYQRERARTLANQVSTAVAISAALIVVVAAPLRAAEGDLDPAFGISGRSILNLGSFHDAIYSIDALPDGKLIAAGNGMGTAAVVARLTETGQLDSTYAENGILTIPSSAFGGYSQARADGSAIVAYYQTGSSSSPGFAASRITPGGAIDPTFGTAGVAAFPTNTTSRVSGMTTDAAGNIFVIGSYYNGASLDWMIGKFTPAGQPDMNFGNAGVVRTNFGRPEIADPQDWPYMVKVDPLGRLVVGGSTSTEAGIGNMFHAIARYTSTGELDSTFDGDGKAYFGFDDSFVDHEFVSDIEFLPNGDLLVASAGGSDTALVRLNDNGSFDPQLGNGGVLKFPFRSPFRDPRDIHVDHKGRILMVGTEYQNGSSLLDYTIGRLLPSGEPDPSFAGGGRIESFGAQYSAAYVMELLPNGQFLAAGTAGQASPTNDFRALIARYEVVPEPSALLLIAAVACCSLLDRRRVTVIPSQTRS